MALSSVTTLLSALISECARFVIRSRRVLTRSIHWRIPCLCVGIWCVVLLTVMSSGAALGGPPDNQDVDFSGEIQPLLKRHCLKCHGVSRKEGQLQLHSAVRIWKGGESGAVVSASNPDGSLLWQRVQNDEMPPEQPLNAQEKQLLHDWISQGAPGLPADAAAAESMQQDEHWAFTHLHPAAPPDVLHPERCRTALDRFVQNDLEEAGLQLADETDRRTLIRRVCFTLTGLPPTSAEIHEFLNDKSSQAAELMIDRYLASPQYGVRWGRHWMDVAGYADSNGYFNADTDRPLAFRYRDYVIRSFNRDKPFDKFVREQLAGDELSGYDRARHERAATPEMLDLLIATHYLRNGQDGSGESDGNPDEVRIDRYTALESTQQIVASSLLGLTFQCAKCHDHKFEPLTQQDFYQFQSVFFPAYNPAQWVTPNDRHVTANLQGVYEAWEARVAALKQQVENERSVCRLWARENRIGELVRFESDFSDEQRFSEQWTNVLAGDDVPAGTSPVTLLSTGMLSAAVLSGAEKPADSLPAAIHADGRLKLVDGGMPGDKWLATQQIFDWTPDQEGQWIQVSFSLVDDQVTSDDAAAERIAYGISLHDFNNNSPVEGGNLLIDGNPNGGATLHLDYPGPESSTVGTIGQAKYESGRTFGVRVTHVADGKFRVQHLVDAVPEGPHVDLKPEDLPDGSFGFGLCCQRNFQVDDVVIEASYMSPSARGSDSAGIELIAANASAAPDRAAYDAELQRRHEQIESVAAQVSALQAEDPGRIAWLTDTAPEPPEVFLLERGEYSLPKTRVEPAPISALRDDENPLEIVRPSNGFPSSGRRLAWANWVTRPNSRAAALMARVQMNRLWQQHFGTGIVSTSENLGMSGAEPNNVALLDWLADQFIKSGWSLKSMHRLVLRSAVFRQSSLAVSAGLERDPGNRLWWRYPLRRLDAEAIRDSVLAITGELDMSFDGPYVPTTRNGTAEVTVPENQPGAFRRSVYLQQRRTQGLSLLSVFDSPAMVINCARRPVTTMPLQSLSLLNSEFSVRRGQTFSERLRREVGDDPESRIRLAFELATAKDCTSEEIADALDFIRRQQENYKDTADAEHRAWADFCQLLLAGNSVLYLE
jgi:hypothetical protein